MAIQEGAGFIYGAQVNTNLIPYDFTSVSTITDLLEQQKEFLQSLKMNDSQHDYLPVSEIVRGLDKNILNILYTQTNFKDNNFVFSNKVSDELDVDLLGEILFEQEMKAHTLKFRIRFQTDKLDSFLVHQFVDEYKNLFVHILDELVNEDAVGQLTPIANYSLLSSKQYQQIVHDWNEVEKGWGSDSTIVALFEKQVATLADKDALICDNQILTYHELNAKANELAHYLRKAYQIKPEMLIGLCLDRTAHMLIGILGILKAGGAYVPFDPDYPKERIEYILNDTDVSLLITNERHQAKLSEIIGIQATNETKSIIALDTAAVQAKLNQAKKTNPSPVNKPNHLAYVMYTSGTTGKPKGVMIEHRGVYSLVKDVNYMEATASDAFVQLSDPTFDAATFEIWGALLNGGRLYVPSNKMELLGDVELFSKMLSSCKITILCLTTSLFHQIVLTQSNLFGGIKYLLVGGEALNKELVMGLLKSKHKPKNIVNGYGPTENTTFSCTYNVSKNELESRETVPIGQPVTHRRVYVLDANLQPLPIGAVGELYVGGAGLGRGYLNKPELTREKFIANPFQSEEEKRRGINKQLYQTGDLVRWLADGQLEYVGRNDFQIKIRGYRVELSEIEGVLNSYAGVKQGIVLLQHRKRKDEGGEGQKYLVGYYVAEKPLDEGSILNYLRAKLPPYMVPATLVYLQKLPLTFNGKLDRQKLPEPKYVMSEQYVAPRNELEYRICQIWTEVLGLSEGQVGIHDDFFQLGGDSIISIQLISQLRTKLNLRVNIKDIFNCKNIQRLSDEIISQQHSVLSTTHIQTEQGVLAGDVPLLPVQEWFFAQQFANPNHWNQSFLIKTPDLDISKLRACLPKLIAQHDTLSMRYKKEKASTVCIKQYYDATAKAEDLKVLDIRTLAETEGSELFQQKLMTVLTDWQNKFDLAQGPIYCIGYLYGFADGSARVYIALHHLIIDGVSWRIILEDLYQLYKGNELAQKGSSYRQWVATIAQYSNKYANEKDYWSAVQTDFNESFYNELLVDQENAQQVDITLDNRQTDLLLHDSGKAYHTQINDILLSAYAYALTALTGESVHHIVLEGHGREEIDDSIDVNRCVGWFTTLYPIRLEIQESIESSLMHTKEYLRTIPNKGVGYGALYGYTDPSLPHLSFNYLGQFEKSEKIQWNITDEVSGLAIAHKNKNYFILSLNGLVINGQLRFIVSSKLSLEMTQRFAQLYKIKLTEVIAKLAKQSRSYLTVSDIDNLLSQSCLDRLQQSKEIESIYLANSLQQGFIYHALNQGEIDDAYRVQLVWEYHEALDIEALKLAWQYAQRRYPTLRLRFDWSEELVQIIDKEGMLHWHYNDLSMIAASKEQTQKIKEIQAEAKLVAYDLRQGNLFSVHLIKQKENLYTCIFSNHHAIIDGWSVPILQQFIQETYTQLKVGKRIELSIDRGYEVAQKYLQTHSHDHQVYWQNKIAEIERENNLSGLLKETHQHIKLREYKHILQPQEEQLVIDEQLYHDLKKLSKQESVTVNAILLYAWHKALYAYGNCAQTVVGIIVSGRNLPINDIDQSVGLYINTLPLSINHQRQDQQSVLALIKEVQEDINEANSKSNVNLASLQVDGARIFETLFVYENYPSRSIKVNYVDIVQKLDYPFAILAYEINDSIRLNLAYAGELLSSHRMQELLQVLRELLQQIACLVNIQRTQKEIKAFDLHYLTADRYQEIVYDWNASPNQHDTGMTIHQLFEERVALTPDHVALIHDEQTLTYGELNEQANQLAHYLKSHYEIIPDTLVGLCLEPNNYMLIGILAVLKAGAAYVPLDPRYPEERIDYILKDSNPVLLLTNTRYVQKLTERPKINKLHLLIIDDATLQVILQQQAHSNPPAYATAHNLAYVMYTSGTTGLPKGVMIEHKGVTSLVKKVDYVQVNATDTFIQLADPAFDAATFEIWGALLNGAKLYMPGNKMELISDADLFSHAITNYKITILFITTALFNQLILTNEGMFKEIKYLFVGGESLNGKMVLNLLKSKNGPEHIANIYGPTENTTFSSIYDINIETIIHHDTVPIGKPLANRKVYVLDKNLQPLPIGAVGELYVGGAGLGRGYLNKPELTNTKFIANPFQSKAEKRQHINEKVYQTGDLVRWISNGNLEFIGRNDFQVKIRGYRVELNEIENILSSYPGIKQSVVLLKTRKTNDGEINEGKYLVGYYFAQMQLDEVAVIDYLKTKLPSYMIPLILIYMEMMPLTSNGKLDRQALPEPQFSTSECYIAPRNELEYQIGQIWADVLGLDAAQIGIYDDFFQLGGNSILVVKLVSKLNHFYQAQLKVADIYIYSTIHTILSRITQTKKNYRPVIKLNTTEDKPNLFMIHPGMSGCEVYISLANSLADKYSCYGIDSCNLHQQQKIDNMSELANYYLSQIDEVMQLTKQKSYNLLGWSLGGNISLEIAAILEKRKNVPIKIYLLDTLLCDDTVVSLKNIDKQKIYYKEQACLKGYEQSYIEKVLANIDTESKLVEQGISSKLAASEIILFKAMQKVDSSNNFDGDKLNEYVINLTYNNLEKVIENKSLLKLIRVNEAHHGTILDQEELLLTVIDDTLK